MDSINKRNSAFPLILSAAAMSLMLVGAGCAPASTEVKPDVEGDVMVKPEGDAMMEGDAMEKQGEGMEKEEGDAMMKKDEGDAMMQSDTGAMMDSGSFKDGTYSAQGTYKSPAGPESVDVTVTVKGDVVTDVSVTGNATHKGSIYMQTAFIGGVKAEVVGKKLADLKVGKIAGSSLTGIGFNEALDAIRAEAKS